MSLTAKMFFLSKNKMGEISLCVEGDIIPFLPIFFKDPYTCLEKSFKGE
jgi:hypothetical protein